MIIEKAVRRREKGREGKSGQGTMIQGGDLGLDHSPDHSFSAFSSFITTYTVVNIPPSEWQCKGCQFTTITQCRQGGKPMP